jgi:hypothetical protein
VLHFGQDTFGFHAKCKKLIQLITDNQSLTEITRDTPLFMEYLGRLIPRLQQIILDDARSQNSLICTGLAVLCYSLVDTFKATEEQRTFSSSILIPVRKFGYVQYMSTNRSLSPVTPLPPPALPSWNRWPYRWSETILGSYHGTVNPSGRHGITGASDSDTSQMFARLQIQEITPAIHAKKMVNYEV